jgi:hypothetical protein
MSKNSYKEKADSILSKAIKSVVFVDENAADVFTVPDMNLTENELSVKLYEEFRELGISLSIDKFDSSKIENKKYHNFLFKKRDLVLLDWKLNGLYGEEYSLKLLSEVVKSNNIHFCSIYTSEPNTDNIINNIGSYFSGLDKDKYDEIFETLEIYEGINEIIDKISLDEIDSNARLYRSLIDIDKELPNEIKRLTDTKNIGCALVFVKLAFMKLVYSDIALGMDFKIDRENKILSINNTIVTIINKSDDSASGILDKIATYLVGNDDCFMKLLGLDMQNNFSENNSFISPAVLSIDTKALLFHHDQLVDSKNPQTKEEFKYFINRILLEQTKLNLTNSNLEIIDEDFLKSLGRIDDVKEITKDLFLLNAFYNGAIFDHEKLNFGDIFLGNDNEYYLCITALCDCLNPVDNINNSYFFVKGTKNTDKEECLKAGDGGFKSYISHDICIEWTKGDYVKPFQLYIENPDITSGTILSKRFKEGNVTNLTLEYKFTLKDNYAQRIANHAFNHPLRVGVDFVKVN